MITIISTHAPHARRGRNNGLNAAVNINFYSRASCEARRNRTSNRIRQRNFYSRASCEARLSEALELIAATRFLLTRLMRGAAAGGNRTVKTTMGFLLTRLMRGAARQN